MTYWNSGRTALASLLIFHLLIFHVFSFLKVFHVLGILCYYLKHTVSENEGKFPASQKTIGCDIIYGLYIFFSIRCTQYTCITLSSSKTFANTDVMLLLMIKQYYHAIKYVRRSKNKRPRVGLNHQPFG